MATLNECNHIITIKYLEAFANGVIQDSNGNIINVNRNVLPSSARTDGYCPTYSMLTGGTLVQNHKANSANTPNDDVDGIIIKGSYAANQCVKQEDMSLRYTRHSGLTISADTTSIGPCDCISCVTLSYDNKYKITERRLNTGCSSTAYTEETSAITDTVNTEIIWGKNGEGTVTYPKFSMPQNEDVSSNTRTTTISAATRFRNTNISSVNSITVTQDGLTGEYKYWREYRRPKALTAYRLTDENFPCSGGTAKANAKGTYDVHNVSIWTDVCGNQYPNKTKDEVVREETETLPTIENTFAEHKCPDTTCSDRWTARFDWGGLTASIDFTQNGTIQCCNCDDLTLSPMALDWAWSATSESEITVTSAACISNITVPTATHFNVSVSGGKITITPKGQNTSATAYEEEITVSYKADSLACSKKILAVQQAKGICPCSCVVVTPSVLSAVTFNTDARADVVLGTISFGTDCTDVCQDAITFESTSGLSNVRISGNNIIGNLSSTDESRVMTCKIKASGNECSELRAYQRCFRGTDNGTDEYYDAYQGKWIKEEHPIALCPGLDMDDDTILVEGCQILNPDGVWVDANTLTTGLIYGGWVSISWTSSGAYGCGFGSLIVSAITENTTTDVRRVNIKLRTNKENTEICPSAPAELHPKDSCCKEWEYPVWQAPKCNAWCKIGNGPNRVTLPYDRTSLVSGSCATAYPELWNAAIAAGEQAGQSRCGSFMTGCAVAGRCTTGTVSPVSNCVSSAATSNVIQIGAWTKTPTNCPNSWEYDSSRPIVGQNFLDLSTLTFNDDGNIYAKVRETNPTTGQRTLTLPLALKDENQDTIVSSSITVKQCAGTTPTTCAVSLSLNNNLPGAGSSTSMVVGNYYTVGSCTKPTTLELVSGDNILYDIVAQSNGYITAKVRPNPSTTASRSSLYRIRYGSSLGDSYATQLKNDPTPTCSATLNMYTNIAPDELNGQAVGTYTTNCEGTPTVTFNGLYSNFLSSISCSNGMVFANVAANVSSSSRQGQYKLTVGGQTSTSIATQLACSMRFHIIYVNNLSNDVEIEYIELRFEGGATATLDCYWEISAKGSDSQNVYSTLSHYGKHVTDVRCVGDAGTIRVTPYDFIVGCNNTLRVTIG